MMTTTLTKVDGLTVISYRPKPKQHQLSVNVGMVSLAEILKLAAQLELNSDELKFVQIPSTDGIEVHVVLIDETLDESPLHGDTKLSAILDEFSCRVGDRAIRHVYGGR